MEFKKFDMNLKGFFDVEDSEKLFYLYQLKKEKIKNTIKTLREIKKTKDLNNRAKLNYYENVEVLNFRYDLKDRKNILRKIISGQKR